MERTAENCVKRNHMFIDDDLLWTPNEHKQIPRTGREAQTHTHRLLIGMSIRTLLDRCFIVSTPT